MKPTVEVRGLDDVNDLLGRIAPREAKNILRATVHGMAGEVRDQAKRDAPEDEGTLKKSIKSKRRRQRGGWIRSDVLVQFRAFYWRFLEYGQGPDGVEHAFFGRAVEKLRGEMTKIMITQFGKKWEAALARAARRNGR